MGAGGFAGTAGGLGAIPRQYRIWWGLSGVAIIDWTPSFFVAPPAKRGRPHGGAGAWSRLCCLDADVIVRPCAMAFP